MTKSLLNSNIFGFNSVKMQPNNQSSIEVLSNEILLQIFWFLDPESLLTVAKVCKKWNALSEDELFWRKKLRIQHQTCTSVCSCHYHLQTGSETAVSKRHYYQRVMREKQGECVRREGRNLIRNIVGSLFNIVMFGPGLDHSGCDLVEQLMWSKESPVITKGMFAGGSGGIGSGVGLQYGSNQIKLVALFRSSKQEREANWNNQDPNASKIQHILMSKELREQWQAVCSTSHAFIYVCEKGVFPTPSMIAQFDFLTSSSPHAPIVLIVPDISEGEERACPLDYFEAFKDSLSSRPWWLYSLTSSSPSSMKPVFKWLLDPPSWLSALNFPW